MTSGTVAQRRSVGPSRRQREVLRHGDRGRGHVRGGRRGRAGAVEDVYARPTMRLPWVQLLQISSTGSVSTPSGAAGRSSTSLANGWLGLQPDFGASARWAIGIWVVFYAVGSLLLMPVREPERRRTSGGALGALGGAG